MHAPSTRFAHARTRALAHSQAHTRARPPCPRNAPPPPPSPPPLVQRLLVASPAQRLQIRDIFEHPWFQKDLPGGSLEYNDWALQLQVQPAQVRGAFFIRSWCF